MKKLIVVVVTLFIFGLYPVGRAQALTCGEEIPAGTPEGVLNDYIADCNSKLRDLSGQKQTLTQALSVLNTQIKLAQAKIAATTTQLDKLSTEIADLSSRISSLDYSLSDLTKIFVSRVRETYMHRGTFDNYFVAQLSGLPNFLRVIEYQKILREHDKELLLTLEKSRLDYDQQKTVKVDKQTEVLALKAKLDREKAVLSSQIAAKNKLLADTNNDEKRYQQLLSDATRQLASFRRFVSSQGGASILSNQTRCDSWGCYYNQRDSEWGNRGIGLSSSSMAEYGCLVTSMAMVASHYGKSLKPGDIAGSSAPFLGSTAYMLQGTWNVNGVSMTRTRLGSSLAKIDEELAAGRPVVVGIYGGPDHFLVVKAKEGSDYIIYDPFPENGSNLKFTSRYPLSAITAVDRVTVN